MHKSLFDFSRKILGDCFCAKCHFSFSDLVSQRNSSGINCGIQTVSKVPRRSNSQKQGFYHLPGGTLEELIWKTFIRPCMSLETEWPQFGPVWLRFGRGTVRAVAVFGSDAYSGERFPLHVSTDREGRFPFRFGQELLQQLRFCLQLLEKLFWRFRFLRCRSSSWGKVFCLQSELFCLQLSFLLTLLVRGLDTHSHCKRQNSNCQKKKLQL